MNLRTRFIVLVLGITIIPFLSVLLLIAIQVGFDQLGLDVGPYPIDDYMKTQHWIRAELLPAIKQGTVPALADTVPESIDLVLVDKNDTVKFSTASEIRAGDQFSYQQFVQHFPDDALPYEFQLFPYGERESEGEYVFIKTPSPEGPSVNTRRVLGLFIPLVLLTFTVSMSVIIIRSIRRSINKLESAAKRIADGDLDFKLQAKGSDEIASLTRSFDSMRQKLKEEYERRARFIMGVSHDLKTPLASIEGYVDAIAEGYADTPEKLQRYLAIIKEKSGVLKNRIGQLIDFVKLNTEAWKAAHEEVALRAFLKEIAGRYEEEAEIFGYRFCQDISVSPQIEVRMDPQLVTRALENLLDNAIRYAEPREIALTASAEEKKVQIAVANKGPGIATADIPYVFEPFYRGTRSRREEGFGLGLATTKAILTAHGWEIAVDSSPGQETVFTITIPLGNSPKCTPQDEEGK